MSKKHIYQDLKNMKEKIKEIESKLNKTQNPHVPKEIKIFGKNSDEESASILSDFPDGLGHYQGLWKNKNFESFVVGYFANQNTGSNYTYKKVDKPEKNKLYFVTDRNDFSEIYMLNSYVIFLDTEVYALWMLGHTGYYEPFSNHFKWENYYEIVGVEE